MKRTKTQPGRWWCRGSYTVEAALTVPLGFLILMSLSCLLTMLLRQNDIQMSLLHTVQSYSVTNSKLSSISEIPAQGVLIRWKEQDGEQYCYVKYREKIPFLGARLFRLRRYQQMAVTDYSGRSMVSDETGDETVYLAENGRVYHKDRECTYLRTRVQLDMVYAVKNKRNQSGGIYYPCESCCRALVQSDTTEVYYTVYGDRYHISGTCPKLKRTVRAVKRSKAGNLPPCSKCGGNE